MPWQVRGDRLNLEFDAGPGLYQLSVIVDARRFDWEELYIALDLYGNKGARTGPWDFDLLHENRPLVPSYWVSLDGRRIGLWYFQRVSIEDMEAKRFRGRVAFHVPGAGRHNLALEPYRPFKVRWMSSVLESDPDDGLEPVPGVLAGWAERCPASAWGDSGFWQRQRAKLDTTHGMYREPLVRAFAWVMGKNEPAADDLMLLLAAHYLGGQPEALPRALAAVERAVALPHWGNPREDGYGHNGDMGAMVVLRSLAWAVHALRAQLSAAQREALLAKLALQGQRFFENALLTRDYWGGSVVQDHGWKSMFGFGSAALHLRGVLPEAEVWCQYIIPRLRRSVAATPRDGVIPPSSYCSPYLYLEEPTHYRDALLALTGHDIFDEAPFQRVVDYLDVVVRESDHLMLLSYPFGNSAIPFIGGNAFLNRMAAKHRDGRAAYLQRLSLQTTDVKFCHSTQERAFSHDAFWGFMAYDPGVAAVERLPVPSALNVFLDSGLAQYHDRASDVTLSVRCGPFPSRTGYAAATGPCDRLHTVPGEGHFVVAVGATPLLNTPDAGYRLDARIRSCLLVDGKGQRGDIGYPMSIPSWRHPGQGIETAQWNESTGSGVVRLDLGWAYPDEAGVAKYTRDFVVATGQPIVVRDEVVLNRPRPLAWLFQALDEDGISLVERLRYRFGATPCLFLDAKPVGCGLQASVQKTPVVWAYSSGHHFKPFVHVRYDATEPVAMAVVEFTIAWR